MSHIKQCELNNTKIAFMLVGYFIIISYLVIISMYEIELINLFKIRNDSNEFLVNSCNLFYYNYLVVISSNFIIVLFMISMLLCRLINYVMVNVIGWGIGIGIILVTRLIMIWLLINKHIIKCFLEYVNSNITIMSELVVGIVGIIIYIIFLILIYKVNINKS